MLPEPSLVQLWEGLLPRLTGGSSSNVRLRPIADIEPECLSSTHPNHRVPLPSVEVPNLAATTAQGAAPPKRGKALVPERSDQPWAYGPI